MAGACWRRREPAAPTETPVTALPGGPGALPAPGTQTEPHPSAGERNGLGQTRAGAKVVPRAQGHTAVRGAARPSARFVSVLGHRPGMLAWPSFTTRFMVRTPSQLCIFVTEFIAVTLVHEIIWVSGVPFCKAPSAYCTVCSPPEPTLHLPPWPPLKPLPPTFPSPAIAILLSVSVFFSAQSRHLSRPPSTPPTAVSLLSVSISLLLVCVFVYFVHQIPRVREIVGHLSFSDWLAVISGPIRAVAKGGLAFLVLADQYSLA